MAGPVEEGAKVATSVVAAMSGQPMLLAIIVINLLFLGAVGWGTYKARESFIGTIEKLIDKQDKMAEMLYRCTPTNPSYQQFPPPNKSSLELLSNPYIEQPNPDATHRENK